MLWKEVVTGDQVASKNWGLLGTLGDTVPYQWWIGGLAEGGWVPKTGGEGKRWACLGGNGGDLWGRCHFTPGLVIGPFWKGAEPRAA